MMSASLKGIPDRGRTSPGPQNRRALDRPTPYRQRQSARRPSKLDSFRGQIVALLERHPYTAQQLLQQLRTQGYAGGYSILKDFVRQVRPVRKPAFLMLDFAPGECAQVDWGSFGSVQVGATRRRLSFFVMVLCYSRMMYLEFTVPKAWSSSCPVTGMLSSFFRARRPR